MINYILKIEPKTTNQESAAPTNDARTINIEGIEYVYSINQNEEEKCVSITLSEKKPDKNITFTYKASEEQLTKDIKPLSLCENLEEKILELTDIFNNDEISVEKKEEKYFLKIVTSRRKKEYVIELEKNEPIVEGNAVNAELLSKIKVLDNKCKELEKEINNLKENKKAVLDGEEKAKLIKEVKENLNLKEMIKETLQAQEVKDMLFKEFEEKTVNKLAEKEKEEKKEDDLIAKKVEESVNNILDEKYSDKIDEKQLNESINKIKKDYDAQIKKIRENGEQIIKKFEEQANLLNEKISNFINLKIEIKKEDIGKDIRIINQVSTYKFFKNFEYDDIEVELNGEKIPIKHKYDGYYPYSGNIFGYDEHQKDHSESQKIFKQCSQSNHLFYWNFDQEGIYEIKIIFKKKLSSCAGMFLFCSNVTEIDISKFDCTNVLSCESMFHECSNLKKINLGKLDFSLSANFSYMFYECCNLVDLDVTNFNTKNSKTFSYMLERCRNLKKIDVSKFNSSKCEEIKCMFYLCENLNEIDMINWDMSNFKSYEGSCVNGPINHLFYHCKKLSKIKISGNLNGEALKNVGACYFDYIPETGELITRKDVKCTIPLDGKLPQNWSRFKE